jgi:hypothetical protein
MVMIGLQLGIAKCVNIKCKNGESSCAHTHAFDSAGALRAVCNLLFSGTCGGNVGKYWHSRH